MEEQQPQQKEVAQSQSVLGHTNFSWTHNYQNVPLGHTQFSWTGGMQHVAVDTERVTTANVQTEEGEKEKENNTSATKGKQRQPKQQQQKGKGKAPSVPAPVVPPQKVLVLHGYLQSGPIWEKKTSSFRRCFNKYKMEFVFPTAPHKMEQVAEDGSPTFKWMETVPAFDGGQAFLYCPKYKGMKQSIKFLTKFIAENGPFDGIIGYSQGGVVASLLLAMCRPPPEGHSEKKKTANLLFPFRWGMIFAGFPAPALDFKVAYERLQKVRSDSGVTDVPTLHIWGVKDDLVLPEHSKRLAELFTNAQTYEHSGGHVAPNNSDAKKAYQTFLDGVLQTN